MGSYITADDLSRQMSEAELVQMTDDAGEGTADDAVISDAIDDAEAEVNGYLQGRYAVPLAAAPGFVRKLCVDVTVWNLYSRRKVPDLDKTAVGLRYVQAVKVLAKLASGEILLGQSPEPAAAPTGGARTLRTAQERTFSVDTLKSF